MKRFTLLLTLSIALFSFSSVNLLLPTNLKITVLDDVGSYIEDAEVTLYGNEDDYRNEENPVSGTLKTNERGQVTFKKLEPKIYYVYVEKGDLNNDGGAVETNPLVKGNLNKVNIIIE